MKRNILKIKFILFSIHNYVVNYCSTFCNININKNLMIIANVHNILRTEVKMKE